MYLEKLKQLEISNINKKYNQISNQKKISLEDILQIFVDCQVDLSSIRNLEKLKTYAKEPIDVVKLSATLPNHTLQEIKEIHKDLQRDGYYNSNDYILIKEQTNKEQLEEEILEEVITKYNFLQEAFDKDYLVDIFIEQLTHEEVIRELLLEMDLLENMLKIDLTDVYTDEYGDVVKIGSKYY